MIYTDIAYLIMSGVFSYCIAAVICFLMSKAQTKSKYNSYQDDEFHCPNCNYKLSIAQTFYEVCPNCEKFYS